MIDYDLLDGWRFIAGKYIVVATRGGNGVGLQTVKIKTTIYGNKYKVIAELNTFLYPPMTEIDIEKILVLL